MLNAQSPRPRIAMISTHGYVAATPPLGAVDTGGQVVYVLELSKKLAELGYEVDIWTRRFKNQPEVDVINEHTRVVRVPCGGPEFIRKEDLWMFLSDWVSNARELISRVGLKYEFVNSHYWDAGIAGQVLSVVLAVPHIHTPHSLGLWKQRQMEQDYPQSRAAFETQYNFNRRIKEERRLYEECKLVVATTTPQVELLAQEYGVPTEKIRMLPPGYDDQRYFPVDAEARESIRQRLGFSGKVIMAIGRLARNKGYDLLIEAFSVVAARHKDAVLHLAIGGANMNAREITMLNELRVTAERTGFAGRICFGSFIAEEELSDYYRAADLFVLSSRYEPFGMTAIEAMASGTPTVVTIHGGLCRALSLGQHALFADPFDRDELGATMAKVFRYPQMGRRLSRMGSQIARRLFTWTGVTQQLLANLPVGSLTNAPLVSCPETAH